MTRTQATPVDLEEQGRRSLEGLGNLIERTTPWLFEVGSWIFGGLIAFNLVIIASLITVGPVDLAVLTAVTALGCALPLNVAGIVLLRLTKDVQDIALDDEAREAFRDAGFPNIDAYFQPARQKESMRRRGTGVALRYSFGIASLSIALTLIGLVASLWHMAWWVGVMLLAMIALCSTLVLFVIARALPPESRKEQELKRRYREQRITQRRESREGRAE